MSIEIESADVIRLIQQYLKESNLTKTLQVIQVSFLSLQNIDMILNVYSTIVSGGNGCFA